MTSAQRARLVVALGVLNLVLATFALAVGFGAPRTEPGGLAVVPTPVVTPPSSASPAGPGPTPTTSTQPGSPGSATPTPSTQPSASLGPTVTPLPTGQVAVGPRAAIIAPGRRADEPADHQPHCEPDADSAAGRDTGAHAADHACADAPRHAATAEGHPEAEAGKGQGSAALSGCR